MSSSPKVSVCIASYNHAKYLPATIDSILAQTFTDFELIITDDGSKDNSLSILYSYAEKHPFVHVHTHPGNVNKGISATANKCIEHSKGEYIAWMGSDDMWLPNLLEEETRYLSLNPKIGMVYSRAACIDAQGKPLDREEIGKDITRESDPLRCLIRENPCPALTAMVRRECFDRVGGYDEAAVYSDWELWVRIAGSYDLGFIPKALAKYRIHDSNVSVGISQLRHFGYLQQMYKAMSKNAARAVDKLGEEKYRRMIAQRLAAITQEKVDFLVQQYHRAIANREYRTAAATLKTIFQDSPATVVRPGGLASVSTAFLKSLVSKPEARNSRAK